MTGSLFRHVRLPFRWHPFWCLLGKHNPVYTFDHDAGEAVYRCFWCGRPT